MTAAAAPATCHLTLKAFNIKDQGKPSVIGVSPPCAEAHLVTVTRCAREGCVGIEKPAHTTSGAGLVAAAPDTGHEAAADGI